MLTERGHALTADPVQPDALSTFVSIKRYVSH